MKIQRSKLIRKDVWHSNSYSLHNSSWDTDRQKCGVFMASDGRRVALENAITVVASSTDEKCSAQSKKVNGVEKVWWWVSGDLMRRWRPARSSGGGGRLAPPTARAWLTDESICRKKSRNVTFIIVWPYPIEGQSQWAYGTILFTPTVHNHVSVSSSPIYMVHLWFSVNP